MAMTFDATLKDMGRESPEGFLAAFDRLPSAPVSVLNVDLSTVTAAADIVYGLGEPLQEIVRSADETIKTELNRVTDLDRLDRMIRRAAKATAWREIVDTP